MAKSRKTESEHLSTIAGEEHLGAISPAERVEIDRMEEATNGYAGQPQQATKPAESKSAKFKRLASKRLPKVVKAIRQLANLAGPGYEYTPNQAAYVYGILRAELETVVRAFTGDKTVPQEIEIPD